LTFPADRTVETSLLVVAMPNSSRMTSSNGKQDKVLCAPGFGFGAHKDSFR
jgi:hypothetical protein